MIFKRGNRIFILKSKSFPYLCANMANRNLISFTARGLKEAREQLKYDNLSEAEKRAYDHHLKQTRYEQNVVTDAKVEGLIEGEAIGLEKGRAEGEAERDQLKAELAATQDAAQKRIAELERMLSEKSQ